MEVQLQRGQRRLTRRFFPGARTTTDLRWEGELPVNASQRSAKALVAAAAAAEQSCWTGWVGQTAAALPWLGRLDFRHHAFDFIEAIVIAIAVCGRCEFCRSSRESGVCLGGRRDQRTLVAS
jgi:hypothetical protein